MSSSEQDLKQLWDEVVDLANRQYESAPFKRLLSLKFSRERAQQYSIQMASGIGATAGPSSRARRPWT